MSANAHLRAWERLVWRVRILVDPAQTLPLGGCIHGGH